MDAMIPEAPAKRSPFAMAQTAPSRFVRERDTVSVIPHARITLYPTLN
jgi:hypothetical protein